MRLVAHDWGGPIAIIMMPLLDSAKVTAFVGPDPAGHGPHAQWGSRLPEPDGGSAVHAVVVSVNDARQAALDRLPLPYSEALRLRGAGIADPVIAEILGVEPEALPSLMELGEAKLAAAMECERE